MFSVIFPGQGSQSVGMAKNLYNNYRFIKELFDKADEILGFSLSKIILEGPKEKLDQTENTQPAIFLVSYSIFKVIKNETQFDINTAKFFAGHSLKSFNVSAKPNDPAAAKAVYSPRECPAKNFALFKSIENSSFTN